MTHSTERTPPEDPFDFARFADPYPGYRRAREAAPLCWSQALWSWVLTRHVDVKAALADPRLSAAMTRDVQAAQLSPELREALRPVDELLGRWVLFRDNPDHRRLRLALTTAFNPALIEALAPRVQAIADDLIDALRGRGEVDLVEDFALRLPARVIAELLGMPGGDHHRFQPWVHTIALYFAIGSLGDHVTIGELRGTVEQMAEHMREVVEDHRRSPRSDVVGRLLAFEHEGQRLSETEILSQCMLLVHGGYESTMNTITSGMLHLLRDPSQAALVRDAPALASSAVEEAMRFEPAFQFVVRVASEDLEIAGRRIERGQQVVCALGAANRDPVQFTDPERFDVRRRPNAHIAFGSGPHFCVGAALARMEGQIAIKTLLRRLPDLRLATDAPAWRFAVGVRSLEKLPVTISTVLPRLDADGATAASPEAAA